MIQPLHTSRATWFVYWVDLEEPVPGEEGYFLPTLLVVTDSSGTPLAPPLVFEELDQGRVESLLVRLFDASGMPDRLLVASSEDWDEEGWREFSREQGLEIRFARADARGPDDLRALARSVMVRYVTKEAAPAGRDVAEGLVRTAQRLRSPAKREALLRLALLRDPECSAARIELADAEFHRGNWKACMKAYEETIRQGASLRQSSGVRWWEDHATRPYLRAIHGKAMTLWHRGRYAEAASELEDLLALNPRDNQGARFFIPMLRLLAEDLPRASATFASLEAAYPGDYPEPALLFGRALCLALEEDEPSARTKYREGILQNIFIAPLLLEEPVPPRSIWLPNDRADFSYASEFLDSYALLWDRESGALRLLREVWSAMNPQIRALVAHRQRMLDIQDQRYDPDFKTLWQTMLDEDDRLSSPDVTDS
jgi:tetratricopeptide (TPR) repeat protein